MNATVKPARQARARSFDRRPSIISKLRNKVLASGIAGFIGVASTLGVFAGFGSRVPSGLNGDVERTVRTVKAFPLDAFLSWRSAAILDDEFYKLARGGSISEFPPLTIVITPEQKGSVPEHVSRQAFMAKLFLSHVLAELPSALERLGLSSVPREELEKKLSELKTAVFSHEAWVQAFGENSRAVGFYLNGIIQIKLFSLKEMEERSPAALLDTILHETLHFLSGGVEGQSHESRTMHELLTSIITMQLLFANAGIPTGFKLVKLGKEATKEGARDKCNTLWLGDEATPSYSPLSLNDEVQEWIARVGFELILDAYFSGDFTEAEKKTDAVFGSGTFALLFPAPDSELDLLDYNVLKAVSKRISRDVLLAGEKLPCKIEAASPTPGGLNE